MFIILSQSQTIFRSITRNTTATKILSSYRSGVKDDSSIICDLDLSDNYFLLIYCIDKFTSKNDILLAKRFIEIGKGKFPYDIEPIIIRESRIYWEAGEFSRSCKLLQDIENLWEMTSLASLLYDQQNWEGVETYVKCIGFPRKYNVKFPSHKISELNYVLGKYYEQKGSNESALKAYDNATAWYPTVWADPILASANIREELGLHNDAKLLIQSNYIKSSLPWSKFFLGLRLGSYMEEAGEFIEAYCVYLDIIRAADLSPIHLVPENIRNELMFKVDSLESHNGFYEEMCK